MFSFFTKNIFLNELLSDFIDIHNHVLPGIDDGAATVEDAIQLLERYSSLGINKLIATPHIMNDYYPNNVKTIEDAATKLRTALIEKRLSKISLSIAAEYMMDQSFLDLLHQEELMTLHKKMVLVEMSYLQPPINLNQILFQLQTRQYKPVLAHPERYVFFHSSDLEKYHDLKARGCFFQLNLLSLVGHYGKGIQEIAFGLLDVGLIDFIGTDTHQIRHLEKIANAKINKKRKDQILSVIEHTKETFSPVF